MSRGNHRKVRDGSWNPREGRERVRGPSGRSGTSQGTLKEVRDGLGDPWRGSGRSGSYETSRGTLREV